MTYRQILVAADESADGRHAVSAARTLAASNDAQVTILKVLTVPSAGDVPAGRWISTSTAGPGGHHGELEHFRLWLGAEARNGALADAPEVAVAFGIAGIEIGRFAALRKADLVVLGRRDRTPDHRLLLGETADAVVRRSDLPVLFVPPDVKEFRRILVALDGTERAAQVLEVALAASREFGAALSAVTVEPDLDDERSPPANGPMPRGRSVRLRDLLMRLPRGGPGATGVALEVRKGNPIDEVLLAVTALPADLLVIGYRRGGPPKIVGPTDIARNLLYAAPSAVLTVPL